MTPRERRHIGVKFAARNGLEYKEVYIFLLGNEYKDEEHLLKELEKRFLDSRKAEILSSRTEIPIRSEHV